MFNVNNKNIVMHELSGLKVKVISSSDSSQKGLEGIVLKETKNTLLLETKFGRKQLVKKISIFKFKVGRASFTVKGNEINFRPEERLDKSFKFYRKRK